MQSRASRCCCAKWACRLADMPKWTRIDLRG
jgi:hypothetical protein